MSYTKYPCQVEMIKYHLGKEGGLSKENAGFMTWKDACEWAGSVTLSHKVPYVVLELRNLMTNELEKF